MTTATAQGNKNQKIRNELAGTGADPFAIAAQALARNEELLNHIQRLEAMLRLKP
ncbi:hypothetical protein [Synechococcus sp. HK01-R]|uniref:hypothetical protein n=1 Tax=Synechococcus sp. HK01-R TaxID=2751171 RepID=UPI0016255631|nr:hypothetical protein [Synechococcus sp. HK01-R]QNG26086.1 hypothetical protein H0O21_07140 [Synechococcus sp. HK01-R]